MQLVDTIFSRSSLVAVFLLLAAIVAFAPDPAFCNSKDAKAPPPDAAAQKAALELVQDVYKDDISKAKQPEAKAALARKLLQAGMDEKKDMAGRFVLFMMARDIAGEAGDFEDVCKAVDQMETSYQIDALKMESDVAASTAKILRTADDRKNFAATLDPLVERAVMDDRYDIAKQLNDLSLTAARLSHDPELLKQAASRTQQIKDSESAYADVKAATAVLDQKPTDPDANLKVGEYRCFVKGDWDNGLPMLTLGSDAALKGLAQKELAGAKSAEEQVKLGDAWWDFAEKMNGSSKIQAHGRATKWYQESLPNIESSLLKAKITKRLKDSTRLARHSHLPVNVLKLIDPKRDFTSGSWSVAAGTLRTDAGWHELHVPYVPKGNYDVTIHFARTQGNGNLELRLRHAGRFVGAFEFSNKLMTNPRELKRTTELFQGLKNATPFTLFAQVRADGVAISLNGVTLIDHKQEWSKPPEGPPGVVICADGQYQFGAIEVVDLEK